MTDDDSRKDPVPSQVGNGSNRYNIVKSGHLGSGHFGDVYLAHHVTTGMKVAVKLEHRSGSIALREWDVMRSMGGDGAPRVYYTGRHGRYYIMVMDLLGATLQRLLESRPQKRLPWDIVATIGYKCVELLKKLHSKGYVHGDVKPENFLCSYSPDTNNSSSGSASGAAGAANMDVKNGLYMVDLGLASRWRDLTRSSGHIQYGQRVDHFSGTVRYASVNAHLGRWLSRRDDLESLAYMMLYLYNGSLPWQGFAGDEKNMKVCERKGMFTVDTLCNNAPEVMQYFLAYVRNMRFEELPDYDYLLLLCQPGNRGIRAVQRLITQQNGSGNGTNANGSTGNAGSGALAGSKRGRGSDSGPTGKRHKVVMPKTIKTSQWIIVSTSSRSASSPLTQCYTSHTTYANLVTEFPRDWVRAKWEEGYFITSVAGSEDSWGVVCSTMTRARKYKQQSYIVSSTFPSKWISEKWNSDYFITSIATQGRMNMHWCVVMSRGSNFQQQCVELDFQYPSQSIHARWDENYMITAVACTEDQCAFVMSRGHVYGEEQRCTRTSHGPLHKIREDWADLLFVSCLAFGRVS